MSDELTNLVNFGVGLNQSIGSNTVDPLNIASGAFDLLEGVVGNTPLDAGVAFLFSGAETGLSQVEKLKIIEDVKRNYHIHASQRVANKLAAKAMPSMNQNTRAQLQGLQKQDWLDKAAEIHQTNRTGVGRAFQRRFNYIAHKMNTKPMSILKVPMSFIPMPDIVGKVIHSCLSRLSAARRDRKHGEYTNAGNRAMLEAKLGKDEYMRKAAKWTAKDIQGLGDMIQRNLFKLKQAVEVLNQRKETLNANMAIYAADPNNSAKKMALTRSQENAAIALFEVKHYVEKVKGQCAVMETTAFTINAYLEGLSQVTSDSEADILRGL